MALWRYNPTEALQTLIPIRNQVQSQRNTTMRNSEATCELLDIDPLGDNTCAGIRRDGGGCRNVVSIASRTIAYELVGKLKRQPVSSKKTQERLKELAGLLLCKRWHQCQWPVLVDDWSESLREEEERRTARTSASSASVTDSRASTRREEQGATRPVSTSSSSLSSTSSSALSSSSSPPLPSQSSADTRPANTDSQPGSSEPQSAQSQSQQSNSSYGAAFAFAVAAILHGQNSDTVKVEAIQKTLTTFVSPEFLSRLFQPVDSAEESSSNLGDSDSASSSSTADVTEDVPRLSHLECAICTEGYTDESADGRDIARVSTRSSTSNNSNRRGERVSEDGDNDIEQNSGIWECTSCLNRTHASCFQKWSEQACDGGVRCVYCRATVDREDA